MKITRYTNVKTKNLVIAYQLARSIMILLQEKLRLIQELAKPTLLFKLIYGD